MPSYQLWGKSTEWPQNDLDNEWYPYVANIPGPYITSVSDTQMLLHSALRLTASDLQGIKAPLNGPNVKFCHRGRGNGKISKCHKKFKVTKLQKSKTVLLLLAISVKCLVEKEPYISVELWRTGRIVSSFSKIMYTWLPNHIECSKIKAVSHICSIRTNESHISAIFAFLSLDGICDVPISKNLPDMIL